MRLQKWSFLQTQAPFWPSELALRAYELSTDAVVKETCFGLIVTGSEKAVNETIEELRKLDPSGIFVKDRGFPPGDSRRCRAVRGGGATTRLPPAREGICHSSEHIVRF